ncbi:hypothetical protein [Oceanobacillus sojae]|uniref:hypothetical protein n=1 Tax=Oceanobacillus sojae TaxID=582851 RepID=UPI00362856F0
MEKVTLPKEVAEAIEEVWESLTHKFGAARLIKSGCLTNWMMLRNNYPRQYNILYDYFKDYPVEYVTALAHGYEVEKTPEDDLRNYYEANAWIGVPELTSAEKRARCNVRIGVWETLAILGIEIEGINA